jgi:hypothetical protein
VLEKEIEILKRNLQGKRVIPEQQDRIILSILNMLYNIKDSISVFQPETLLKWQRNIIKGHWTFKHNKRKPDDIFQPYEIRIHPKICHL